MKIAIVNSSDLGECWSALRYTGNCHRCTKCNGGSGRSPCPNRLVTEEYENLRRRYRRSLSISRKLKERMDAI